MSHPPRPELRELAVKIAMSYARSHPTPVDVLPSVIKLAYSGLLSCASREPSPQQGPALHPPGRGRKTRTASDRRR